MTSKAFILALIVGVALLSALGVLTERPPANLEMPSAAIAWPRYSAQEERDLCERQGLMGGRCAMHLAPFTCPPACDLFEAAAAAARAGLVERVP